MDPNVSNRCDDSNHSNNQEKNNESPTKDKLFDPSIDMLMDDFDDERTLEEEEALAAGEANDPSAELSNLQKEGNMPLEELLALYGYDNTNENGWSSDCEAEEESNQEEEQICVPLVEKERSPTPPRRSKLSLLYEPMNDDAEDASRAHRAGSRLSEEDEEDYESGAEDDEYRKNLRKTIMVGNDYQAQVPDGLSQYEGTPQTENEDKLLWNPQEMKGINVEEYLEKAYEIYKPATPKGEVLRDDEMALYILQQCDYNTKEALKRLREVPPVPVAENVENGFAYPEEECRNLEAEKRSFRTNLLLLEQNKVND